MTTAESFVCNICGEEKPESEFYRNRSGRMHRCKACHGARVKEYRESRINRTTVSETDDSPPPPPPAAEAPEMIPVIAEAPEMADAEDDGAMIIIKTGGRRLARVKTALKYANLSHTKLYELIRTKRVKAYRFDNRTLVDLDSIDAMFAALPEVEV